jgi:hypothetical protein
MYADQQQIFYVVCLTDMIDDTYVYICMHQPVIASIVNQLIIAQNRKQPLPSDMTYVLFLVPDLSNTLSHMLMFILE